MSQEQNISADVIVVGFGKGGKTAAQALLDAGKRVVLIERSENMYGGTCPNVGCVPTKMLVHYSNEKRAADDAGAFFADSIEGVRKLTAAFRQGNFDGLNARDGALVITGTAQFTDSHTVKVGDGEDAILVSAETILINTGSEPIIPNIEGFAASSHLTTNVELISLESLPEHLIVIGGGYQGLEFASIYRHFGSEVTVLEANARLLPREDADVADAVVGILAGDGVKFVTGANVLRVSDDKADAVVEYEVDGEPFAIRGQAIVPATGRRPVTAGLGLENAGVEVDSRGAVVVDQHLRTTQAHIFALGDVNGGEQFTYISLDDARIVLDQLLGDGKRTTTDRIAVPHTLFVTPPLATVGLTETRAQSEGLKVKVSRENVADIIAMPRAYTVEETRGLMKFIVDADTDLILGAALLSIDAQEIINTVAIAMRFGITATQLRNSIYTHPSSTEAFNEVFDKIIS